ncbi:MAG: metallophosphoesterase [Candidatus Hodarchaeota archaeon]
MKILIAADLHLRKDKPKCRLDENWIYIQEKSLEKIVILGKAYSVDFYYFPGDIFEYSNVQDEIKNMFLKYFLPVKDKVIMLPGNHDLPYHNYNLINKSSYGVIRNYFIEDGFYYGQKIDNIKTKFSEFVGIHILVWEKSKPINAEGLSSNELFELLPNYKYIFTGDNHHRFIVKKKGRFIINPGCITRQAADFKNYIPSVYILNTKTDKIEKFDLPDIEDVVTDNYIIAQTERDERLSSFVQLISEKKGISLDYRKNIIEKFKFIDKDTQQIIEEILDESRRD